MCLVSKLLISYVASINSPICQCVNSFLLTINQSHNVELIFILCVCVCVCVCVCREGLCSKLRALSIFLKETEKYMWNDGSKINPDGKLAISITMNSSDCYLYRQHTEWFIVMHINHKHDTYRSLPPVHSTKLPNRTTKT